ncbi:hypothetical protein [Paraburkholderia sp. J8-2]|uniref:hypothetical protein n=1 Tax=Paraburkholderia sp. J8-2 TaxID=2805440 RepID=UPI002AB68C16|nr:hypothetical protein [Paraburkholderia sp. J8-2]
MATEQELLIDSMSEAEAHERLGYDFTHAIVVGVAFCDRCRSEAVEAEDFSGAAAYETAGRIARLIRWIDSHDTRAPTVFNGDGTLTVTSTVVFAGGLTSIEREVIPATLRAARALLGY